MHRRAIAAPMIDGLEVFGAQLPVQLAPEMQIEKLHPITDPEHGQRPTGCAVQEGSLPRDALSVFGSRPARARAAGLRSEGSMRRDLDAAGQFFTRCWQIAPTSNDDRIAKLQYGMTGRVEAH